jgi:hypothetical protein
MGGKEMSKTTATVIACLVCFVIIAIYATIRVVYGLTGWLPGIIFFLAVSLAWKGIRGLAVNTSGEEKSSLPTGNFNRKRPIFETLDALSNLNPDSPVIRLICHQIIINDGLSPVRNLSPEEKRLLNGREAEMKEVEAVLRKVYENPYYHLTESAYFDALKQLLIIKE